MSDEGTTEGGTKDDEMTADEYFSDIRFFANAEDRKAFVTSDEMKSIFLKKTRSSFYQEACKACNIGKIMELEQVSKVSRFLQGKILRSGPYTVWG